MDIRPFYEHKAIMTCPERAYQKSFGIDSLYASIGTAGAGLTDIAIDNLKNLHHFSRNLDFTGIPVDVSQFGTHGTSGGWSQEGTQYIGTAWELLKQTGDRKLLEEMYPGLKHIHAAYRLRDTSGDFWPEGMTFPGTSERVRDMVGEPYQMVGAAVRMWWATKALSEMANELGLTQDADGYKRLATQMQERFNRLWWCAEESCWAVGMGAHTGKTVFSGFKTAPINYAQKYRLANWDKGQAAVESVWKSDAMDDRFSYHGSAPTVWQNSNFAIGCFNYDKGVYGLKVIRSSAACPTELTGKMMGSFSTINPDPRTDKGSNQNKIMYSWCAGPYLESIINGLFGIGANAFDHSITCRPYVPKEWNHMSLRDYRMGSHVVDFLYDNGEWNIRHKSGSRPLQLIVVIDATKTSVALAVGKELTL